MSRYWSRGIAELATYVPGEQPQDRRYVKLNTNENPYPASPRVMEAIRSATDERLRLYPDPECVGLRDAIARRYGLTRGEIFVGNGSDEILAFAFAAFFDRGETILFPDISYSFYPVYADFFKLKARTVALNEDYSIPVDAFLVPNGGIIFPNPNAPTSLALGLAEIRRLLDHNLALDRAVIVDEAYVDFGAETASSLVGQYPNLLVVQTLSKSRSLAGLRGGFALGHPDLVEGLSRVKNSINSYTLDRLAQAGAIAAIEDEEWFEETRRRVMRTRDYFAAELRSLGFDVADSRANFLFMRHATAPAAELYSRLKEKGVLVRYFRKPRIDNHLRVSVGTDEEMEGFLAALSAILASYS